MEFALHAETITVGELLSGRYQFVLPEFQRDYSWGVEQAEHLIEDIDGARLDQERAEDIAPYFLGNMLFAAPAEDDPVRQAQIIDGQQRITTLTILFAVLRDLTEDADTRLALHRTIAVWSTADEALGDQFHLTPRSADRDFLVRMVQKDGATTRRRRKNALVANRPAHENIARVRAYFIKRLGKDRTHEERHALARFLMDRCCVLTMRTPSLDFAYQIFLTLNTRGLALTDDDIVAAEVIGPLDRSQKERFQPIIAQLARYRDKTDPTRPRGKTFFSHLTALHGWGSNSMITELRRAVVANGGPYAFTRQVFQPMAEAFLLTRLAFDGRDVPGPVREELEKLMLLELLCDDEWVATAMIGLSAMALDDPKLPGFLKALDRFAHAQLALRPIRSERRKRYRRVNQMLRGNPDRIGDGGAVELTEAEQQKALSRIAGHLANTTGRFSKTVLMRLDAEFSGRPIADYIAMSADDLPADQRVSVEHILPCGSVIPQQSQWRTAFPDMNDRVRVAEHLGNLCLISEGLNRKLGQKPWQEKRDACLAEPLTSSFALVQGFKGVEDWNRTVIAERHGQLMETVSRMFAWDGVIEPLPPPAASTKPIARKLAAKKGPLKRGRIRPRGKRP